MGKQKDKTVRKSSIEKRVVLITVKYFPKSNSVYSAVT